MKVRHRPVARSLVGLPLALYPSWWRERQGEELAATGAGLVAEGRLSERVAAGLPVHAVDARLLDSGPPPISTLYRWRTSAALVEVTLIVLAVLPLIIWIAVSTGVNELSTHQPGLPVYSAHGGAHGIFSLPPESAGSHLSSMCASLMVLIAGAILVTMVAAWVSIRHEFTGRGLAWLVLWISPVFFAVTSIGLSIWSNEVRPVVVGEHGLPASHGQGTETIMVYAPGAHPFLASFLSITARGAMPLVLVSAVGIVVALARFADVSHVAEAEVGFARTLSVATVLAALAVFGWTVGLAMQPSPHVHHGYAFTHAALAPWSVGLSALMAVAAALVVTSAVRARRCWRVAIHLESVTS